MLTFYFVSAVIILTGIFAYINTRLLKLPMTIGLMLLSTVFSFLLITFNYFFPDTLLPLTNAIQKMDFSRIVLDEMLCFLLFAGAMHTDYNQMKQNRKPILIFSFFGVMISMFLIGSFLYSISLLFNTGINYLHALLFGALISPTDPVAILGILTKTKVPKTAEINIVGESLFNDGIGVVLFISILSIVSNGIESVTIWGVCKLFIQQAIGGLSLGLVIGYIIYILLKSINDYETEVMITLIAVVGGNWLSHIVHVSGPLAMVVAGLMTGYKSRTEVMSNTTKTYIDKFWHLIESLMNAVLFVLIGLKILSIHYQSQYLILSICLIPLILLSRYISLAIPYSLSRKWIGITKNTITLMTWGGLRGGLSIAMALSLPDSISVKNEIVFLTYSVVFFSIFVQGLSVEKFAKRLYNKDWENN